MLICCERATWTLPGSYFGHRCEQQHTSEKEYAVKLVTVEVFGVFLCHGFKAKNVRQHPDTEKEKESRENSGNSKVKINLGKSGAQGGQQGSP